MMADTKPTVPDPTLKNIPQVIETREDGSVLTRTYSDAGYADTVVLPPDQKQKQDELTNAIQQILDYKPSPTDPPIVQSLILIIKQLI